MSDLNPQGGSGDEGMRGHVHGLVVVKLSGEPSLDGTDNSLAKVQADSAFAPAEVQIFAGRGGSGRRFGICSTLQFAEDVLEDLLGKGVIQNVLEDFFLFL